MSPETKVALTLLAVLTVGLALIFAGIWPHYKLGAVALGVAVVASALSLFATLWRGRP